MSMTLLDLDRSTGEVITFAHGSTDLGLGLEVGDTVLLTDLAGRSRAGVVVDLGFSMTDTLYHVSLGRSDLSWEGEVPTPRQAEEPQRLATQDVVDLLHVLRSHALHSPRNLVDLEPAV